jgi:deoxyribose-phosphate aldolase
LEPKTDKIFPFMTDRISKAISAEISSDERKAILKFIPGIIDLTSLEGIDTQNKIKELCEKALNSNTPPAAVCTYAVFLNEVGEWLEGSDIKAAVVAGGFPSGQVPASIKTSEVQYAVDRGADEVDFVINRGLMLEGRYDEVYEEVFKAAQLCKDIHFKVILETGELKTVDNIRRASEIAITAGADFIKTSTGKVQPAATLEATLVMLDAISDHYRKTRKMVGIKPAGGIGDTETALKYYLLVQNVLGREWLNKSYFRIGASRLFDRILDELSAG